MLGMEKYLEISRYIDWGHPAIVTLAGELSAGSKSDSVIARRCFEWVRDSIKHSWDYRLNPVTCKASDVLRYKTGYCYAKSHLLAALLRANRIPAGLCYQRLSVNDDGAPYCLHGLNAVFLQEHGWYRIDARGNKSGVNADFCPPQERLAFTVNDEQEQDFAEILAEPLDCVARVLMSSETCQDVYNNLPDADRVPV